MYDNNSLDDTDLHDNTASVSMTIDTDFDSDNDSEIMYRFHGNTSQMIVVPRSSTPETLTMVLVTIYLAICVVGLVGNCLVVVVVSKFAKMRTVTNVHILNLSVADAMYLAGLPMVSTTAILKYWAFGQVLCKVYYILTSINMFTGTFTLTLMSADRFCAVWYPIKSLRFRTTKFASVEVLLIWIISIAVMFPIVLYATQVPKPSPPIGNSTLYPVPAIQYSCIVVWPAEHPVSAIRTYIVYTFAIGFLVPVALISVFYLLLVLRLRSNRMNLRTGSEKRRRGKRSVTTLVTIIITVFIVCWLPYWLFQVRLVFGDPGQLPRGSVYLFQFFTVLTYLNSAVNPLLYAFTNDSFKKAFVAAFHCHRLTSDPEGRSDVGQGGASNVRSGREAREAGGAGESGASGSKKRMTKSQTTVLYDFSGSVVHENDALKVVEPFSVGQSQGVGLGHVLVESNEPQFEKI